MGTPAPALRGALLAVMVIAGLAAAIGLPGRATFNARVTADEPQYLLTATSLIEDASLDISDELAARRYLPYHEITVDTQTRPDRNGRAVSPHDPLLPLVLAVPMGAGGWVAAKATLVAIGALAAALTLWVAVRRFDVDPDIGTLIVGGGFAALPLAPYGSQVYPELPAAAVVVGVVALLTARTDEVRRWTPWVVLAGVTALPWLAVKYLPVAAVLAGHLLWRHRQNPKLIVGLSMMLGVSGALYLFLHQQWYGGWTVYAAGDHFAATGEFSVVGTEVDWVGRSRRLTGLLVDRGFGIGVWSPVWLSAPFTAGFLLGRARDHSTVIVGTTITAGWLTASFVALTMHGWWVPGRQLVVILPLALIAIAYSVDRCRPLVAWTAAAVAVGAGNWAWLAMEAATDRRTLVVDFAETSAPPYRIVRPLFGDGIRAGAADDARLATWSLLLAATAVAGWRHGRSPARSLESQRRSPDQEHPWTRAPR